MAEVRLDHVTKVFSGDTPVVDDVCLEVRDGEFLVLVGPSGCGKSTILRMIAGLEDVTSGRIVIGGRDVTSLAPKERDIAMVFQNYALYPHMDVRGNMTFALKLRKVPHEKREERVLATARTLELDDLLARKPKALSGGQRQRVAMGRAIVRDPQVFLMDEPLSNLDAKLRVSMRAELIRLHHLYRTTTVYVTHDQIEAMTLGDRIAVVDRGRLQQVGTPHELYEQPVNVFVAGFMGSPSMSMVRCRLLPGDPPALAVGGQRWPLTDAQFARVPSLAGYVGRTIVLGLRPPAFTLPAPPDGPTLSVTVTAVEALGHQTYLLFDAPAHEDAAADEGAPAATPLSGETDEETARFWTARVDGRLTMALGDRITLGVDLDQAYFFDPTSHETLRPARTVRDHDVQAAQELPDRRSAAGIGHPLGERVPALAATARSHHEETG